MNKLTAFLVLLLLFASCINNSKRPYSLTTEHRSEAWGVGTRLPRLSWKNRAGHGERQTAYRILVASSPLMLWQNKADLWDSGIVESEESYLIPFGGNPLPSGQAAWWKVETTMSDGTKTTSEPAYFSVGLLEHSDWKGAYIGFPKDSGDPQSPLLRTVFEINETYECALLHVNSLGYHEAYINGNDIDAGPLAPAVSQLGKRSLSRTYNVTNFIKKGKNELTLWLGKGWYQNHLTGVEYDGPVVRAQLDTWFKGKCNTVAITDSSWQASESGYTLTSRWNYANFGGERIDATVAPENLSPQELDKRLWTNAVQVNITQHTVSPQNSEKNIISDIYKPLSIKHISDSTLLVDMGKCFTGWTTVRFPQLPENHKITLSYCDHLNEQNAYVEQGQQDIYIASGKKGGEQFRNRFNYHSYRYIKIDGLSEMLTKKDIEAYTIRTGYADESTFVCSDPDLNAIHDLVKHTLHNLSLSGYLVDCHHFERLGYGGDGHASTLTAQTMFHLPALYADWLQAWADCIRDDGGLPHTAPNPYPAGGGPYWCAFIVSAPWNYYLNYGDRKILEQYYPVMKQWMQYVDKYTVEGLLAKWPDTDYRAWYLGDWATPRGINQTDSATINLVDNCVVSECLTMLEKIAILLEKTDDAKQFAERKTVLNRNIHLKFYNSDSTSYATGSQIDNIYPLLVGVTPPEFVPTVVGRLFSDTETKWGGNFATGLVGLPVLVDWSVKNNQPDFVYKMLKQRDYPGYLYMLDRGATAVWEHWDGNRSRLHNCYNGIGAWFYQAVGGITPLEDGAGYRRFRICPQIPEGVSWAKTTKETPYGTIIVNWELKDGKIAYDITVPAGCEGVVVTKGEGSGVALKSGRHIL